MNVGAIDLNEVSPLFRWKKTDLFQSSLAQTVFWGHNPLTAVLFGKLLRTDTDDRFVFFVFGLN